MSGMERGESDWLAGEYRKEGERQSRMMVVLTWQVQLHTSHAAPNPWNISGNVDGNGEERGLVKSSISRRVRLWEFRTGCTCL